MNQLDMLRKYLSEDFKLPPLAAQWLCDLWQVIQTFDDIADHDDFTRQELDKAIWLSLIGLPANPFYLENYFILMPVVSNMVLKWKASDTAERDGKADAVSFVWRAGYYDVVLTVFSLCHGPDASLAHAHIVMSMYGEKLENYLKEFENA